MVKTAEANQQQQQQISSSVEYVRETLATLNQIT